MNHDFCLQLVVTRNNVRDADFDEVMRKLREIKEFSEARGWIQGFAISITNTTDSTDNPTRSN